jgi:hypothetical protein
LDTAAVSLPGNTWSVSASPSGEVFIALVGQTSGGEGVLAARAVSVSGDDPGINFVPQDSGKNVASGVWHNRSTAAGSRGDWLLWIPASAGTYVLDAENISLDPYMYLYDGLTGTLIESDDDGGDSSGNSRIQRSDFVAGHPYLIRVRGSYNSAGNFRFKAEAVAP